MATTTEHHEAAAAAQAPVDDPHLVRSFSAHVAQYVGIGMVSGSVVHASTLGGSSLKYAVLIAAGTLIYRSKFLIESGFRIDREMGRFLAVSTVVSLGTGMLSGSAQHFLDGPRAGAVLASVGVVIAYVSFCFRENRSALTPVAASPASSRSAWRCSSCCG
jgi:hypothetical protein